MNTIASLIPSEASDADRQLQELLKRCSPATYVAALAYRRTGRSEHLVPLINGIIARYLEPDLRSRLHDPAPELRLVEDLGLDSLTMLEIVLLVEEVLVISIDAEELRHFRTIGDVQQFVAWKAAGDTGAIAAALAVA